MAKKIAFLDITKEKIGNFKSRSFLEKCDIISFVLLFLFFIDCSFSGGGKYLAIGPLTFRIAAGIAALVFAMPKLISNIKKYIRNPIFYMFFGFFIYLIISAIIGFKANNNMGVLISDLKGFMWLFIAPALIVTIDNKKRFESILNAIVIGSFIQAIIVLVIHFGCCLITDGIKYFYQPMIDLQICVVNSISNTVFRIFMRSCPYMVLACSIVFFKQLKQEKLKAKYFLTIVLFLFCVLLSFTRSLFGCVFIVFVFMVLAVLIFYRKKMVLMVKTLGCVVISLLLFVGMMEYAFDASYLNFAISRSLGTPVKQSIVVTTKYRIKNTDWKNIFCGKGSAGNDDSYGDNNSLDSDKNDNDKLKHEFDLQSQQNYIKYTLESDSLRSITKRELRALISKSPIIGNGLGACSQSRNGPDEYFYYDILARMGFIGLLLYIAPFIYVCIYILKNKSLISSNIDVISLLCGVFGFWIITWFNPWMNAALGIAVYSLSCSIVEIFKNQKKVYKGRVDL